MNQIARIVDKTVRSRRWLPAGLLGLALLMLLLGGCSTGSSGSTSETVAEVNGEAITKDELYNEMVGVYGQQTLEEMIADVLLRQQAEKADIEVTDAEVEAELADIRAQFGDDAQYQQALLMSGMSEGSLRDVLRQNLIVEKILGPDVEITDDEVRQYFEDNKEQYGEPEQVRARHILVETEEEANELRQQIVAGADFAELAAEKSTDPGSAAQGGELGFFPRGKMDPAFEETAFSLAIGDISEPVQSQWGWHVIEVEELKEAVNPTLEEVEDEVRDDLLTQKVQQQAPAWMSELRAQADITNNLADGTQ